MSKVRNYGLATRLDRASRARSRRISLFLAGALAVAVSGTTLVSQASEVDPFFRDGFPSTAGFRDEVVQISSPTDLGAFAYTVRLTLPDLADLPLPGDTRLGFDASASFEGVESAGSHMRVSFRLRRTGVAGVEVLGHGNDLIFSSRGSIFLSSDMPVGLVAGDVIEVLFRFTSEARLRKGNSIDFGAGWSVSTEDPDFLRREEANRQGNQHVVDTTRIGGRISTLMRTRHKGSFAGFERVHRHPIPELPAGLDFQGFRVILTVTNFTVEDSRLVATVIHRPANGPRKVLGKFLIKSGSFTIRFEPRDLALPPGLGAGDELQVQYRVRSGGASRKNRLYGFSSTWSVTTEAPPTP